VSVIVPVYNCERYMAEAIGSVIGQAYRPIEVIVVDDGSTDGTAALVKSLDVTIRYIYQRNRGPAAARNRGLAMARGDVIAFLDADDYWPTNKLEIQLKYLKENPGIEVVMGRIQCIGMFTEAESKIRFEGPDNTIVSVNLGSGIFRKSVFDKVGVFDESLRYFEDHDWFLRAREEGISMAILKATTLYYRLHENNTSRTKRITEPNMIHVLKKSIDRRRKQNRGVASILPEFFDFDERKAFRKHRRGHNQQ
jgi:glycosyltransferase involved in cell wall biosynthesis